MVRMHRTVQSIGDATVQIVSRAGFEFWDAVDPAAELIASYARLRVGESVLVWPCGNGALAVWARAQADIACHAADSNLIAVESCQATAEANDADIALVSTDDLAARRFDAILMPAPKGRHAARMMLARARDMLAPDGRVFFAGANKAGIKSVLKDAGELFASVSLLGYKRGLRVARLSDPIADASPVWLTDGIRPGSYRAQEMVAGTRQIEVWSRPGVFSWQHLDVGTELLIRNADLGDALNIVDVGCGSGVIGAWAALERPDAAVLLSDVDAVAVDCARQTLAANGIANAKAVQADGLDRALADCSLILSNPPFHAGHGVAYDMVTNLIDNAPHHLAPGGRLILVANRFLPYDRHMHRVFGQCRTLVQTGKFHVLEATWRPRSRSHRQRRPRS